MINVYLNPNREEDFPKSGGVREHLVQLKKHLECSESIKLLPWRAVQMAQVHHIEATYSAVIPNIPLVFTCHGGFVPNPMPIIMRNLYTANCIVSVASWLIDRYFPQEVWAKTVVIPNGVDLTEFDNLPSSNLEPGYILYGKEWRYYFEDFLELTSRLPRQRFVTVYWPDGLAIPSNITYIGRQSRELMKSVIKDAGMLLLTGSEVNPIMLLEAWAAGTPVLAKNMDGNREVMMPRDNIVIGGVLYDSIRSAAGVVRAILEHRIELGAQGRHRVDNYYRWTKLIKCYEDVYKRMCK